MTMPPELIALSVVAWMFFITSVLATYLPTPSADSFFARIFDGLTRMLELGWAAVTRRG